MSQPFSVGLSLAAFICAVLVAAAFGATFKPGPWYAALAKPAWTLPNWVFAPVWSLLYAMIAIAGWTAWRRQGAGPAIAVWYVALVLNAAWSWLFFGQHRIGGALVDIAALWCAIVAFIVAAWHPARPASLLFIPYLLWVTYAAALNLQIWRLNS
jgi:tryptophan-rich sensory protein